MNLRIGIGVFFVVLVVLGSCKKEEDPSPEDLFVGTYLLDNVIEEHNPSGSPPEDKFLAPLRFDVTKNEFLDPVTGNRITAYKFFLDDLFLALTSSTEVLVVSTQNCPNTEDLSGVSISAEDIIFHRLNMINCEGREVIADYNRGDLLLE